MDVLALPRQLEICGRRGRRCRGGDSGDRGQPTAAVEDRDAVQLEALELEAESAAEREACSAVQPEDRRQLPGDRDADRERRGGDVDVDAAARMERERDVTADRDDPVCAD